MNRNKKIILIGISILTMVTLSVVGSIQYFTYLSVINQPLYFIPGPPSTCEPSPPYPPPICYDPYPPPTTDNKYTYLPHISRALYPLFVGLHLRWDGNGYIRGNEYYDIGYHKTRDLDQLTDGYIIRSNNHGWYNPDPLGFGVSYWYSYYDVTTGEFLSSSVPGDPSWMWEYYWILPYSLSLQNGQTVNIDNQAFIVSGPIAGFTSWGRPIQYWELVNRDKFLYWDGGGDWKQYVYTGEAILRYDAGNTRLLIYDNVKRHDYYQGNPYNETIQYIDNLTGANSFPGSQLLGINPSESIPDVTTSISYEIYNQLIQGPSK